MNDAVDPQLLETCRAGTPAEVQASLRTLRETFLGGGPPAPAFAEALRAIAPGLATERGGATLALVMFFFDVLMYVPAGLRTPKGGPAAEVVRALEETAPHLSALRTSSDRLLAAWAWHLLSWMPTPAPGLAEEALEALGSEDRSFLRITLALAAASTPHGRAPTIALLDEWLTREGNERNDAAMVLALLVSDPTRTEATSEPCYEALLALAERPPAETWGRDEWDAAPAREHGFYADLATNLVRAGYPRADTTLPALLFLVEACPAAQVEHVLDAVLKIFYHSSPYEGDPSLDVLTPTQRATLAALVRSPRAWALRPRFYATLSELGLPRGAAPMAAFLDIEPPAGAAEVVVTSVEPGVLTVKTARRPDELVAELAKEPAPRAEVPPEGDR